MKKSTRLTAIATALAATLAIGVPIATSAGEAGQTVELKSTITMNPYGSAGKVTSSNANCTEQRQVVIKQKGIGKIGAAKTDDKGAWKAQPTYKGALPYKIYAEVKPVSQGTAGTIYKCLGATSKIRTINGG